VMVRMGVWMLRDNATPFEVVTIPGPLKGPGHPGLG
jgi:hypothetical protein